MRDQPRRHFAVPTKAVLHGSQRNGDQLQRNPFGAGATSARIRSVPASSIFKGCGHDNNPFAAHVALPRIFQDQASGDEGPPTDSPLETRCGGTRIATAGSLRISAPQFETGAAGTVDFKPGGVAFWDAFLLAETEKPRPVGVRAGLKSGVGDNDPGGPIVRKEY